MVRIFSHPILRCQHTSRVLIFVYPFINDPIIRRHSVEFINFDQGNAPFWIFENQQLRIVKIFFKVQFVLQRDVMQFWSVSACSLAIFYVSKMPEVLTKSFLVNLSTIFASVRYGTSVASSQL